MHDALRMGAKLYKDAAPLYRTVRFVPNKDTPPDVRAEYLRAPYVFGISNRDDILGWTRHASNATVLKMGNHTGVQALILFERERPEAFNHMHMLVLNRTVGEFSWLQDKLATMQWSEKQLDIMGSFVATHVADIWRDKPNLLNAFVEAAERYGRPLVDGKWLNERLENYPLGNLMQPFGNATVHKASLAESWRRVAGVNIAVSAGGLKTDSTIYAQAVDAANGWHARGVTKKDCLDLAQMFDAGMARLQAEGYTAPGVQWREHSPSLLPWLSMLGPTPEEGQRAVEIYQQLDPDLLTFLTIATAVCGPQMDTIDNASELLCP